MAEVLVVDDSKVFRDLVTVLLENDGFGVRTAVDGDDALKKLEESPADAIILDIVMPKVDGREVLRQIRERRLADGAYIVVLTADDDPDRPTELAALGADAFVTKPFDTDGFTTRFREFLAGRTTPAVG